MIVNKETFILSITIPVAGVVSWTVESQGKSRNVSHGIRVPRVPWLAPMAPQKLEAF
jgi:hypothetical protein